MSILEEIEKFDMTYNGLSNELDVVTKQLAVKLKEKMAEINPIIDYLKANKFYFTHPDLGDSFKTTVGVIIGRNVRTLREIYVYDGTSPLVYKISTSSPNEKHETKTMLLNNFLENCDHDFALQGIEHTREALNRILQEIESLITRRKRTIDIITKA